MTPKQARAMTRQVHELERLSALLSKYRNAYYRAIEGGGELSSRMYGWIDTYDEMRGTPAWLDYCKRHGYDTSHTALDTFA